MANFDLRNQQVGTQYIAGRDIAIYQQIAPLTLTEAQQKRNRTAMLDRVRLYWIKGVLERSLSGTNLALGLREQTDIVTDSRYADLQEADHHVRDLPPGTPIQQVYTDADGKLLILGEPGSGKRTLLLELARDLLDRATNDETHPIPVVLNLSSWILKQQPLSLWLVEELERKYLVPRKLAVSWVANDQILPMLDGLDEVAAADRASCIEAINAYQREHGLVPLVVSCRSADYATQQARLQVNSTIVVQPLTRQQIDDYLAGAGEQMNTLRLALRNDPVLQELATTPLMLSILMRLYQEKRVEDLVSAGTPAVERQRILAKYVERMLQQRGREMPYQQSQVVHWLSWLAQQLTRHSQTQFFIERMQPDWLSEPKEQRVYERLGVRLPGILIGIAIGPIVWIAASSINDIGMANSLYYIILMALIGGVIGGLFSESSRGQRFERSLIPALITGVFIALVAAWLYKLNMASSSWFQALRGGGVIGLASFLLTVLALNGFVGKVNTETRQVALMAGSWRALLSPLLKAGHLRNGGIVGLMYGLGFWLDNLLSPQPSFPFFGGLAYGLILGISGIILSLILGSRERTIEPVEVLVWSWRDFRRSLANLRHLRNGVLIGAICGVLCGLSAGVRAGPSGLLNEALVYAVGDGLAVGLSYWLFVALLQGVSGALLEEHRRLVPNQGIRLSARNGLFLGSTAAVVSAAFAFLAVVLRNVLSDPHYALDNSYVREAWIAALIIGVASGLVVGLLNGWLAYIRHRVLRVLLSRAGVIPPNYPGFLDEVAARALLRRVGSSYIFIHQLLLNYFAKIETVPAADKAIVGSAPGAHLTGLGSSPVPASPPVNALPSALPQRVFASSSKPAVQTQPMGTVLCSYRQHSAAVRSLSWSPDSTQIVSVSGEKLVHVWDAMTGRTLRLYQDLAESVQLVAWYTGGGRLATAGSDACVRVWDMATNRLLVTYQGHGGSPINALAWSPKQELLASASTDGTIHVWNALTGQSVIIYRGHCGSVSAAVWSPDGQRLVSGGEDTLVQVWEAFTGKSTAIYRGRSSKVLSTAWSPDMQRVACGREDGTVQKWEVATNREVMVYRSLAPISIVAWSPEGRRFAFASGDNTVQVWDTLTNRRLFSFEHPASVRAMAWSPDGKSIASGGDDAAIQVWIAP